MTTDRPWPPKIDSLVELARRTKGFMPEDEGDLLLTTALDALRDGPGLEVGTWCGKTAVLLGAAARVTGATVFTVDHHRGSEENQPGWEWHDASLVDTRVGRIDTLPSFRATMTDAGLEEEVVGIVGRAPVVAAHWRMPLALLFVDGGHTDEHVTNDYEGFGRWVQRGGRLVVHDVFADPAEGGQAPWRCWRRAVERGDWEQVGSLGSMRVLRRVRGDAGDPLA